MLRFSKQRLTLACLVSVSIGAVSCLQMPGDKARGASNSLQIPKRYDASQPPVPEVASGLMSIFSDSRVNSYVNKALRGNPDLKASAARLEEAGFNTRKAYSGVLPSLTFGEPRRRVGGRRLGAYSRGCYGCRWRS